MDKAYVSPGGSTVRSSAPPPEHPSHTPWCRSAGPSILAGHHSLFLSQEVHVCGAVCGSGSDPDSIGSVDPDSESGSGSRSRRAKMTHKSRNSCFEVLEGLFFLRAEGVFCNLDVLYGGLGKGKLYFWIQKKFDFFSAVIFFQFLVIKALNPDRYSI